MMRIAFWLVAAAFCLSPGAAAKCEEAEVVLEWRPDSPQTAFAHIEALSADGKMRVRFDPRQWRESRQEFRRGVGPLWVAAPFVASRGQGIHVMSGQALEATTEGLTIQLSADAVKRLAVGEKMLLRNAQEAMGWIQTEEPITVMLSDDKAIQSAEAQNASKNNLRQILLALHNYHETFQSLPPAVVYGPDGRPWHSWRVLILPYLEQSPLYNAYRFEEPWDSEHNRQLLEKKPMVYHDPARAGAQDSLTHYVAAVGKNTVLSDRGAVFGRDGRFRISGTRFREIVDGTSNTVAIGAVNPKHEIPWTKPEDIVFDGEKAIGAVRESFAWPYQSDERKVGLFGIADGSVRALVHSPPDDVLQSALTIHDGQAIQLGLYSAPIAEHRSPTTLRLLRKDGKLSAEVTFGK